MCRLLAWATRVVSQHEGQVDFELAGPPEAGAKAVADIQYDTAGDGLTNGAVEDVEAPIRHLLATTADHAALDSHTVGGQHAPHQEQAADQHDEQRYRFPFRHVASPRLVIAIQF
jgi:hypothetical protein